jgi:hypothetical protein
MRRCVAAAVAASRAVHREVCAGERCQLIGNVPYFRVTGRRRRWWGLLFACAVGMGGQHPIQRGTTDTERGSNGAGRLITGVHPLGQSHLRLIKRLGPADGLLACPRRIPRRRTAFAAQLQLKFGEAGEDAGEPYTLL